MHIIFNAKKCAKDGFTLIELLIVIAIIGILSTILVSSVREARDSAYFVKSKTELNSFNQSVELYKLDHNETYPADTDRALPPGLEEYLGPGIWPGAAWPGSVFDWDNWNDPDFPGKKIIQISIRFCPKDEPAKCKFPNQTWASSFDYFSAVFYCIEGRCRSHNTKPSNHSGYCVNCKQPQYPYGIY